MEQAIRIAGNRSVVMLFGLTKPDDTVSVKPFDLFRRELTIRASYINPYTMGRAVDLINAGRLDVHSMVAQAIPLSGLRDVLADPAPARPGQVHRVLRLKPLFRPYSPLRMERSRETANSQFISRVGWLSLLESSSVVFTPAACSCFHWA